MTLNDFHNPPVTTPEMRIQGLVWAWFGDHWESRGTGVKQYELRDALADQHALQINSYGKDPHLLEGDELMEFIRWNILALEDELHEALAECGWKPWATSKHLNAPAFRGELVDAFHFLMNLLIAAGISADEFLAAYQVKRQKNAARQAEGYDGVSTKCLYCGRAIDDDAVLCDLQGDADMAWCELEYTWYSKSFVNAKKSGSVSE